MARFRIALLAASLVLAVATPLGDAHRSGVTPSGRIRALSPISHGNGQ